MYTFAPARQCMPVHKHVEELHSVLSPVSHNVAVLHAGLWEFPAWQLDSAAACNRVSLRQLVDDKLPELIGITSMSALGSLQVVKRVHLGSVLHTFSHIQQTMHIELLVLQVCSLVYFLVRGNAVFATN